MYSIDFYQTSSGQSDVFEFLEDLRTKAHSSVLFFYYDNGTYILLHHFRKHTQKTPRREIDKAISEMNDYILRKEQES